MSVPELVDGLIKLLDAHGSFAVLLLFLAFGVAPVIAGLFFFHRYVVVAAFDIFRNAVFGTLNQYVAQQETLRQLLDRMLSLESKVDLLVQLYYKHQKEGKQSEDGS